MRPQSPRRSCSPPVKSRWFRPKITPTCRRDGSTLQGRLGPRPRVRLLLLDTLRATEVLVLYRHQFTEVTSTFVVICFCEQHDIFGLGAKSVMHLSNFFGRHKNIFFESLRAKTTSLSFFKRCVFSNKKMRTVWGLRAKLQASSGPNVEHAISKYIFLFFSRANAGILRASHHLGNDVPVGTPGQASSQPDPD